MAFTKVTNAGIGSTGTVLLQNLDVTGVGTFGGNLSVGGTLTYEDVTNVDSVGLITARSGIKVGSGITLSPDGEAYYTGITTIQANDVNSYALEVFNSHASGQGVQIRAGSGNGQYALLVEDKTGNNLFEINADGEVDVKKGHIQANHGINVTGIATIGNNLIVNGTSTFNDDVILAGASANVSWDKSSNYLQWADNAQAVFGASADLKIFHDGTDSTIDNDTGALYIKSNTSTNLLVNNTENAVVATANGAVEIYYDNAKKIETKSDGLLSSGSITITGQNTTHTAGGLAIGYEGSHIHQIRTYGGNASNGGQLNLVTSRSDASNSKTITLINSSGHLNVPDNQQLQCGNGADLKLYHESSSTINWIEAPNGDMKLQCTDGDIYLNPKAGETGVKVITDGAVELYHNNSKKLSTEDYGVKIHDAIFEIADTSCLIDLMETSATNHRIRNGSGNFYIQRISDDKNTTTDQIKIDGGTGAVEIYYNGNKKFETASYGTNLSNGNLRVPDANPSDDTWGRIQLGAGQDLEIFHDGSNSVIEDQGTGSLYLKTNSHIYMLDASGNTMLEAVSGGKIQLRYNNETRFETINTGCLATSDTTSHPGVLKVKCTVGASSQGYIGFEYGGGPTSGGGISRNGTSQTPEFYSGSDRRIKKDIVNLGGTLSKLNQIQIKSFGYKDDPDAAGIGPIAQDLISVFPDKVTKSDGDDGTGDTVPDGAEPWTVGTGFTWEIIKAIQELSAENEILKAKVAALESA